MLCTKFMNLQQNFRKIQLNNLRVLVGLKVGETEGLLEGDNEGFGVGELLGESDGYEMFKHEIQECIYGIDMSSSTCK